VVRVDGPGTKYATAEKRNNLRKKADERMWILRRQNLSDKDISKKLEEEFGLVYKPKSIASRLPKLQKEKQEEEDQRLDEELSDWHVGEVRSPTLTRSYANAEVLQDEKLYQAYGEVETKINAEIAKLEAKKWNEVSKHLANKMPERKYTGKACKERFDGLLDGTAELPIELDPDKDRRRILREARIAEAKRAREEAKEAARRAVEAVRQEKIQRKAKALQIKKERQDGIEARRAEKELDKRLKKAVANAKSNVVQKRRATERQERQKRAEKEREQELENIVYSYYTGKYLQRRHHISIKNGEDEEEYISDDEKVDGADLLQHDQDNGPAASNTSTTRVRKTEKQPAGPSTGVKISKQSLLNPRSIMTLEELDLLLAKRDLPRRVASETHPQVVARLAAADKALKMSALEDLCLEKYVSRKGNRKKKVALLQKADAKDSAKGKEGVEASDLEFKKQYEGYHGKAAKFIDED
jgi:hypothetical protein